jgi:ABC-type uncharacterized transport system involved in gliding motility auxiliary subunit
MVEEDGLINRVRLGRILSVVGAASLVVAVIALVAGGANLLKIGALVVAAAGLGGWLVLAPDDFRAFISGRRVRYGGFSALVTVLSIGVLVLLYVLATRNEVSIDFTETQRYSLSDASKEALADLQTPIHIVGFYSSAAIDARDNTIVLLRQYKQATGGLVTFEFIDPDLEPTTAAAYGVTYDQVLYALKEGDTPENAELISYADERQITRAILKLTKSGDFKVYFITGHGEYSPSTFDASGLSSVRQMLSDAASIEVDELNLLEVQQVPDAEANSALVIAGARSRFSQAEVDTLASYLESGGRLMILADPPLTLGQENFMDEHDPLATFLWEAYGVRFRRDVVISQSSLMQVFNPVADHVAGSHPTTQRLQQRPTVFFQARTIEAASELPDGVTTTGLIFSAIGDYAETDFEGLLKNPAEFGNDPDVDTQGPLTMAMSVVHEIGEDVQARLVLVGDSEFIVNDVWDLQGNPYFFLDSIDWLTEYSAEITVEAVSDTTQLPVFATTQQQTMISVITIVLMPFSVLAVGLVVWWSRRRR